MFTRGDKMTYTTTRRLFNQYPSEFEELSLTEERRARTEFDQITAIEQEIKQEAKSQLLITKNENEVIIK